MKVVIISTNDLFHGAGIAAYRFHLGLRKAGIDSAMLVSQKLSDDEHVYPAKRPARTKLGKLLRRMNHLVAGVMGYIGMQNVYSVGLLGIMNNELIKQADIIHFHSIHGLRHNFSLLLFVFFKNRPIIWTIHDMWPLTGHCYYDGDCNRWRKGCGRCPDLNVHERLLIDTTSLLWKFKRYVYSKARPLIVAPSKWLTRLASEAPVFQGFNVRNIPNGVDQSIFRPMDKAKARKELGINQGDRIILFLGMQRFFPRKGYKYFTEAMLNLKQKGSDFVILLVGKGEVPSELKDNFTVKDAGLVRDEEIMAKIYSAADIYVMPSIQDNLPSTILESMACGTPVVCFNNGGMPDMVEHLKNGYLAKSKDVEDLAKGIDKLLKDPGLMKTLGANAIATVTEKFSEPLQIKRYIELYEEILKKDRHKKY